MPILPKNTDADMPKLLKNVSSLRKSYTHNYQLTETTVAKNPFLQFERWMQDAIKIGAPEPTAMTLATVNKKGQPAARVVLLKGLDKKGFIFYTNYKSDKGAELAE